MTNRMIENRIRKLHSLEQRKDKLDEQIDKVKGELIAEMARKKTECLETDGGSVARYQHIVSERFDSAKFKLSLPEVYKQYLTPKGSHRFTYNFVET